MNGGQAVSCIPLSPLRSWEPRLLSGKPNSACTVPFAGNLYLGQIHYQNRSPSFCLSGFRDVVVISFSFIHCSCCSLSLSPKKSFRKLPVSRGNKKVIPKRSTNSQLTHEDVQPHQFGGKMWTKSRRNGPTDKLTNQNQNKNSTICTQFNIRGISAHIWCVESMNWCNLLERYFSNSYSQPQNFAYPLHSDPIWRNLFCGNVYGCVQRYPYRIFSE